MSVRALVDTNVLLDVLARREPFFGASQRVWTLAESREIGGLVSAISFNNCWYIVRRFGDRAAADEAVRLIRRVFEPVDLTTALLDEAMNAGFDDFEDSIQHASAHRARADVLVTRDPQGFRHATMDVLSPVELLARLMPGGAS